MSIIKHRQRVRISAFLLQSDHIKTKLSTMPINVGKPNRYD